MRLLGMLVMLLPLVWTGCVTSAMAAAQYEEFVVSYLRQPMGKALVCALSGDGGWACGTGKHPESALLAEGVARSQCNKIKVRYGIAASCELLALDNIVASNAEERGQVLRLRYILSRYNERPTPKALACAWESDERWSCALSGGGGDPAQARQKALELCRQGRVRDGVLSDCRVVAENDTVQSLEELRPRPAHVADPPARPSEAPAVSRGTCFAVTPEGHLITARHIVEGATEIRILFDDEEWGEASLVSSSAALDIALLEMDRSVGAWLPLVEEQSMLGEEVFTMGFPVTDWLGSEPKFTEGSISALSGLQGEYGLLQVSVPIQPGNSGGPLVDWEGRVVGMIVSKASDAAFLVETGSLPQNVNWAVKSSMIRPFVRDAPTAPVGGERQEVIARVLKAVCQVEAIP